jgi:hypothetical protein
MKIVIEYNPISFKTEISSDNQDVLNELEQTIQDIKQSGKRITSWFENFITRVKEETNQEVFHLEVKGCDEYEAKYIREINGFDLLIETISNQKIEEKYKLIDSFIEFAKSSDNSIIKNAIKGHLKNFESFISANVEVPVIATMSSGKSTLLNALIGQNLLPAKNKATTATTCEIKINNSLKNFRGVIYKRSKKEIAVEEEIDGKFIREWNGKANEEGYEDIVILIEGPVKNLNTHKIQLSLIDTPGPNNSQNENHKESTFNYLKDNQNLPIILYILNAQQIATQDDEETLLEIKKAIEDNKENLDRIIFILNRIDGNKVFDKEDPEPVEETIRDVKEYLKKFEINSPKIFPISAEYAKLSQLELDSDDEDSIRRLEDFRRRMSPNGNREGFKLLDNSSLIESQKRLLADIGKGTQLNADLVYSGLAALKLYIEDYIANHHLRIQYNKLYKESHTCSREILDSIIFNESNLKRDSKDEIRKKSAEFVSKKHGLKVLEDTLSKKVLKLEINRKFFTDESFTIQKKKIEANSKINQEKYLSKEIAQNVINELFSFIKNAKLSLKTTLISKMKGEVVDRIEKLKMLASSLFDMKTNNIETNYFSSLMVNNISSINIGDLEQYAVSIEVEKKIIVPKTFLGAETFFGIFAFGEKEVYIKINEDYIDIKEYYTNYIQPLFMELLDSITSFEQIFNDEIKKQDKYFIDKVNSDIRNSSKIIEMSFNKAISLSQSERDIKLNELKLLSNNLKKINLI